MATNSNPSGEGVSDITPLGSSESSSNAWLNIDGRIEKGTVGSRPNSSSVIGGDKDAGVLFKGDSAGPARVESNSGSNEKMSSGTNQYGDAKVERGTVGSRQEMTIGGDYNSGDFLGQGAGATKEMSATDQLVRDLPKYPGLDLLKGTSDGDKNMDRAMRGLGSGKTKA